MHNTQLKSEAVSSDPFAGDPFDDESFFLSDVNLTATVDQRDLEAQALEMMSHPLVVQAREVAMGRFRILGGKYGSNAPAEALEGIEAKMDEWAFHYLLLALNGDANYPKVLGHGYGPPHKWLGMDVLGCRGLGTAENPDNHYCFIPVDVSSRLEIHGKVQDPQIEDVNFWLTANLSQSSNVNGLNWKDVNVDDDGRFVITIDRFPADGRRNHLQSTVDTMRLFIRDSRKDWDQRPNAYRVRRLDPPTAPPMTIDELATVAKRNIIDDVATNFWFRQMVGFLEPNAIHGPDVTELIGGMRTQKVLRGRVDLEDDEGFVLTMGSGGSKYWVMTLYDWWLMSGDYWSHTSSLNNGQCVANADGTHTLVYSIRDPGVHNWIDTEGLHHTLFLQRWQMLPPAADGEAGGEPTASCEVVKLDDLRRVLPPETKWVTPQEREQQLADRLAAFNRRHEI
jgi:hypothetical protein